MIIDQSDSIHGPRLNDRAIPDFPQVVCRFRIARFFKVVMQWRIEYGKLDANVREVIAGLLERVVPVFATAEDVV